jgi:hypothetical protein
MLRHIDPRLFWVGYPMGRERSLMLEGLGKIAFCQKLLQWN